MKSLMLAGALVLASVGIAFAADAPAASPYASCKGEIWVIRKSQIIPGGTYEGFLKAVADQTAWYRKNGVTTNEQRSGKVFETDAQFNVTKLSSDMVETVHINAPKMKELPVNDAGWKAFVAEFQANSKIVEETQVCVNPKG